MVDPSETLPEATNTGDIGNERHLDADMEDPQEDVTTHTQDPSSSTLDHEPTQPETQPTSSLPHMNRKDTTLREFLSKMDDYAPIVRTPAARLSTFARLTSKVSSFSHRASCKS
jgi:hypothetical protein